MPRKKIKCTACINFCFSKAKIPYCKKCFHENNKSKYTTKEYRRGWFLKKKYNISLEEFHVLWIAFKGKCGICNIDMISPLAQQGQPLNAVVVDHNHDTGNMRGLLCNGCNKGLGLFKDNPSILLKAKEYLDG